MPYGACYYLFLSSTYRVFAEEIKFTNTEEESYTGYFFKTLPKNLLLGTKESLWGWNLALIGAGAGTAIVLSQTDADNEIQGGSAKGSIGDFAIVGSIGGNAFTLGGISVSTYIIGRVIEDEKIIKTGKALIEAEIITAVMTSMIKVSTGRDKPDGSGNRFFSSFPSGHTSGFFSLASTVDTMYGHEIGIPLYVVAEFVGFSRLSDNKHFLSDILFSAALGTAIGRGVATMHKKEDESRLSVLPYTDSRSTGLFISLSW